MFVGWFAPPHPASISESFATKISNTLLLRSRRTTNWNFCLERRQHWQKLTRELEIKPQYWVLAGNWHPSYLFLHLLLNSEHYLGEVHKKMKFPHKCEKKIIFTQISGVVKLAGSLCFLQWAVCKKTNYSRKGEVAYLSKLCTFFLLQRCWFKIIFRSNDAEPKIWELWRSFYFVDGFSGGWRPKEIRKLVCSGRLAAMYGQDKQGHAGKCSKEFNSY